MAIRAARAMRQGTLFSAMVKAAAAGALAAACAAAIPTASAQAPAVVKIGAVLPLSGPFADSAKDMKRVYDLYQKQFNAAGGFKSLKGAKVEFVYVDAQSKPEVARASAERLALAGDVSALIGPVYSPLALTMAEVAERHKIPLVIDSAIEDSLTEKGYKYIFRPGNRSQDFAAAMSQYVIDKLKPKSVALVYADTNSGAQVMSFAKDKMKGAKIPVLFEEPYALGTTNFGPIVQKIARFQPEVIISMSYDADAILLAKTIAEQKVKLKGMVGSGGGHSTLTFIKGAAQAAENVSTAAGWNADDKASAESAKYFKAFKAEYGETPNQLTSYAANATMVLLNAIERAGSADREKIRAALKATDLVTPHGRIQFDDKNQGRKDARVLQVQNGEFVTVWPDPLATKKVAMPMRK